MDSNIPDNLDLDFCIDALRGGLMLREEALQVELAVGLIVFDACGASDINAKKVLRSVYASAGEIDCLTHGSRRYATTQRRMDRIADLRDKLKPKTISKWIKGKSGNAAIEAIKAALKPLELRSMDDVAEYTDNPRKRSAIVREMPKPEPKEQEDQSEPPQRRATDREEPPGTRHLTTAHIDIAIPPNAAPNELLELAMQLMALAKDGERLAA